MSGKEISQKVLDNWFSYHPTFGDRLERYALVRDVGCKGLALSFVEQNPGLIQENIDKLREAIIRCCPDSWERSYALSQLEKLTVKTPVMEAIEIIRFGISSAACSAIACNESPDDPVEKYAHQQ